MAGVELTFLDCLRYFLASTASLRSPRISAHRPIRTRCQRRLPRTKNSDVRRLGYWLEWAVHSRQARALEPFARQAKTTLSLDPAVKPLAAALTQVHERNAKWKLVINEAVEVAE